MSFLSSIKRLFGFGSDDDEFNDISDVDEAASRPVDADAAEETQAETVSMPEPVRPEIDPAMKARIFDYAVAVFNESLPEFLRNTVDPGAQSRRLAEGLDKGVSQYLDSIVSEAQNYAEARLKVAAVSAHAESERLRKEMENLDQQRNTLREQKLSADRRHRALADRVKDLEAQLAAGDAEREQLDLEKRSLINKLKVADVQPGVVEEMAEEIETLKARLEAEGGAESTADNGYEALKEENTSLRARLEEAKTVRTELEKVRAEADQAKADAEQARKEADAARISAEKAIADATDMRTQQEAVQGMYNDLHSRFCEEKDAREKAEHQLAEARTMTDGINEIQEQMNKVEEVIRKRDEKISRLRATNKKLREQLASLEETLRNALPQDDGLFGIDSGEEEVLPGGSTFSDDTMSAIEEDFECPDWFVSEPAPGEVSHLRASDIDFGYQEPPKKPRKPENDAQLSLF